MKLIKGDLLKSANEGKFDVIGHGCNCFCTMGSGIAKAIRAEWPRVYSIDCMTAKGDMNKLGTCSTVSYYYPLTIVNCYTQYRYGRGEMHADYQAIRTCMAYINMKYEGKRVGLPKIGCGLAGGDWSIVKKIMEEELADVDLTVMWL